VTEPFSFLDFGFWNEGGDLVVPVDPLIALVALLSLQREGRDRASLETLEGNRISGFLAVSVGAVIDAGESRVDLGDQLALAVAGAEFDGPIRFRRGPIGEIGVILIFALQGRESFLSLFENIAFPADEFTPEILPLPFIHEGLVFCRSITLINNDVCHVRPLFPNELWRPYIGKQGPRQRS
jgi:hypothetical protein